MMIIVLSNDEDDSYDNNVSDVDYPASLFQASEADKSAAAGSPKGSRAGKKMIFCGTKTKKLISVVLLPNECKFQSDDLYECFAIIQYASLHYYT